MIRLPPDLLLKLLEQNVLRGSILRFWWETAGKHKFGIVLNASWPESGVLLVITTSKVAFYDRVDLGGDIVRIAAGAYPCFPKDTVINLRQVIEVTIDDLVARGRLRDRSVADRGTSGRDRPQGRSVCAHQPEAQAPHPWALTQRERRQIRVRLGIDRASF